MSDEEYQEKRTALLIKHSHHDGTFAAMQEAMEKEDTLSAEFWHWKIDQYLYGQYTEFQPIYDAYKEGRSFEEMYGMGGDPLIAQEDAPPLRFTLPEGYFTGLMPGDPQPGWSHYADGKIYVAYEGDLTDPYMVAYDVETDQWDGPYKAGHSTLSKNGRKRDSHGKPAMEQDTHGYLHIIFGGHGGEREDGLNPHSIDTAHAGGRFLHVVSDKPNDISSFTQTDQVSPFASYAQSCKMANGDIYFFTRAGTHKSPWIYYKLRAGNRELDPPVIVTWPTSHRDNPIMADMFYVNTFVASDTDIIVTSMWHECNHREAHTARHDDRFNAYYMRLDTTDDTFYDVEDQPLDLPILLSDANERTLVYDSVADGTIVNHTRGLPLQDGKPAMSYELRFPEPREWKMATYENGKWTTGLPMPGTDVQTLVNTEGDAVDRIDKVETLTHDGDTATAAVIYQDDRRTRFAIAKSDASLGVVGQDWKVEEDHVVLSGANMRMDVLRDEADAPVGVVFNVSKGGTRRLYLWHDGELRPNPVVHTAE